MKEKDKESASLYLDLGVNQLGKGNTPGALSSLLKAESLDPTNAKVQNHLGLVYFTFKKMDLAQQHFARALALDSKYTEARNNYARSLIELGSYKEAQGLLHESLADLTYPVHSITYLNLGLSYFKQEDYKSAIAYFQKSIKLSKAQCLAYHYYGRSLYELKDYKAAVPVFDIAVPLCKKTGFDEAHYYGALTYFKSGDKTKGIALMNETVLLYPDGQFQEKAKGMIELMRFNRL